MADKSVKLSDLLAVGKGKSKPKPLVRSYKDARKAAR